MKKFVTFCLLVIMPMTLAAHNRDGHCERRGLPPGIRGSKNRFWRASTSISLF